MSSAMEDLHESAFGFRPAKAGQAHDRLAAVVLARLGWTSVDFDTIERSPGRSAKHQLDVTTRRPSGELGRMIIECKDWDKSVGKATLDALVGLGGQIAADAAAVVTTKGFARRARLVALDEAIAMIRLRAFDPENPDQFVRKVEMIIEALVPSITDFGVEVSPTQRRDETVEIRLLGDDRLLHLDGSRAETPNELARAHGSISGVGSFPKRVEFSDERVIPVVHGDPVRIRALTWVETVASTSQQVVCEARGEPVLVVEQLDENEATLSGCVVVDRDLFAWMIDDQGNVVPRGGLWTTCAADDSGFALASDSRVVAQRSRLVRPLYGRHRETPNSDS